MISLRRSDLFILNSGNGVLSFMVDNVKVKSSQPVNLHTLFWAGLVWPNVDKMTISRDFKRNTHVSNVCTKTNRLLVS